MPIRWFGIYYLDLKPLDLVLFWSWILDLEISVWFLEFKF